MKLMPCSSERSRMAWELASSTCSPKVMVPRQMGVTSRSLAPSLTFCMEEGLQVDGDGLRRINDFGASRFHPMPEGPSIVILREEATGFLGKKIARVEGNTKIEKERLEGKRIVALRSWGKHFLIE